MSEHNNAGTPLSRKLLTLDFYGNWPEMPLELASAEDFGTFRSSLRQSPSVGSCSDQATGSRMVTNSSADVGCIPMVESNWALVAPALMATASP